MVGPWEWAYEEECPCQEEPECVNCPKAREDYANRVYDAMLFVHPWWELGDREEIVPTIVEQLKTREGRGRIIQTLLDLFKEMKPNENCSTVYQRIIPDRERDHQPDGNWFAPRGASDSNH